MSHFKRIGTRCATWAPKHDPLQTSATTQVTLATFTLPQAEGVYTLAIRVNCRRRTSNTKRGAWHFTAYAARCAAESSGAAQLDQLTVGDFFNLNAGTVTVDVSGNDVRVRITPADTDSRDWTCEMSVLETGTA